MQAMDWNDIFGNSSQRDNLYDFLLDECTLKDFVDGFYPDSPNQKIAVRLMERDIKMFKHYAKEVWNIVKPGCFPTGNEEEQVETFIKGLSD